MKIVNKNDQRSEHKIFLKKLKIHGRIQINGSRLDQPHIQTSARVLHSLWV